MDTSRCRVNTVDTSRDGVNMVDTIRCGINMMDTSRWVNIVDTTWWGRYSGYK